MSYFDFDHLDISKRESAKQISLEELRNIIKEQMSYYRSPHSSADMETEFYDDNAEETILRDLEMDDLESRDGFEIVEPNTGVGVEFSSDNIDFFGGSDNIDFFEGDDEEDLLMRESDSDFGSSFKDRFPEIPGLEGPETYEDGRTLYYDPKEGRYYDRLTDVYLDRDDIPGLPRSISELASKYNLEEKYGFVDKFKSFLEPERRELPSAVAKKKEVPEAFLRWHQASQVAGTSPMARANLAKHVLKLLGPTNSDREAMEALTFWIKNSDYRKNYEGKSIASIFNSLKRDSMIKTESFTLGESIKRSSKDIKRNLVKFERFLNLDESRDVKRAFKLCSGMVHSSKSISNTILNESISKEQRDQMLQLSAQVQSFATLIAKHMHAAIKSNNLASVDLALQIVPRLDDVISRLESFAVQNNIV